MVPQTYSGGTTVVWEKRDPEYNYYSHWTSSTMHIMMHLFTDGSGSEGWGSYWSGQWLEAHWISDQQSMDITWKGLYVITVAVHTFMGTLMAGSRETFSLWQQSYCRHLG